MGFHNLPMGESKGKWVEEELNTCVFLLSKNKKDLCGIVPIQFWVSLNLHDPLFTIQLSTDNIYVKKLFLYVNNMQY